MTDTPLSSDHTTSRRSFLNWLWAALGLAACIEFIWVIISYLTPGKTGTANGEADVLIHAGSVDQYQPGTVTAFPIGRFYLACLRDNGFLAISRRCTHLGCTVPWDEDKKQFLCPCHSSTFDIQGNVIDSPALRALDIFDMVIENNQIMVNTGKRIKRSEFKKEQVTYASKL